VHYDIWNHLDKCTHDSELRVVLVFFNRAKLPADLTEPMLRTMEQQAIGQVNICSYNLISNVFLIFGAESEILIVGIALWFILLHLILME
jgi:hypothetical protein